MLGFPLLYFKGMKLMMFQLSSFYCISTLGHCPDDMFETLTVRWGSSCNEELRSGATIVAHTQHQEHIKRFRV